MLPNQVFSLRWLTRNGLSTLMMCASHSFPPLPPSGLQLKVGGSPATVSPLAFASRRFLSDMLVAGAGGGVSSSLVLGPGAEVMAQSAARERRVRSPWTVRTALSPKGPPSLT